MQAVTSIILDKLYSLHRFGIKPGLERTFSLAKFAGNPHKKFPLVHVAGTNGKGSVSSYIASILTEAGYKTGLYTSPHLAKFNERIRINGREISDTELIALAEMLMPESDRLGCTFFEITTVMAFKYFESKNVDIAVIETGMGGRFDSTNIITPEVSVITTIGLEHREYLGNSLAEIAFEKAGIIKQSVTAVIGPNEQEAMIVLANAAIEKDAPAIYCNMAKHGNYKLNGDLSMTVDIYGAADDYTGLLSPLGGRHQVGNLKASVLAIESLAGRFNVSKQDIIRGIKNLVHNTGLAARTKLLRAEPPLIIDVSHNSQSVRALVNLLAESNFRNIKWNILLALMDDKDAPGILQLLKPVCRSMTITKPSTERSFAPEVLMNIAGGIGIEHIAAEPNPANAMGAVLKNGGPALVLGSFYLIGELMENGALPYGI